MTSHPHIVARASLAMVALALVATLAGCDNKTQSGMTPPPAQVGVMVIQPQHVPLTFTATGRLSAYRSADVRARVSGVLLKRTYTEGTHVEKGQPLFQIDPAPLKAALDAAEAALAQAQAQYTNASITAARERRLQPKGYVSKSALDDANAAERTAKAAVQAAKAKVEQARIDLGYASVRSPIAGRAGRQQVTEGALVGQSDATLLTTVRQINPLYVNFSLPVNRILSMRASQADGKVSLLDAGKTTVHLTLPGGASYAPTGTLDFAGVSVDPATGAVTLRALVPNPKHVLLPGMYVTLSVDAGTLNDAYLIPQDAILRDAESAYVLAIGKDDKVARMNVTTDGMRGGDWIVTSGLKPGVHIVVEGIPKATIGSTVKPVLQPPPAGAKPASGAATPTPAAGVARSNGAQPGSQPGKG